MWFYPAAVRLRRFLQRAVNAFRFSVNGHFVMLSPVITLFAVVN